MLATLAGVCVVTGLWWDNGGQHWAARETGTYCGSTGTRYCYWSGFGSVFPWVLLTLGGVFGFLGAHLRMFNCHEQGCWRLGRYAVAAGTFRYCGHHHPDWEGSQPSRAHILRRHELHKQAVDNKANPPGAV